jgi:hypothetical protein
VTAEADAEPESHAARDEFVALSDDESDNEVYLLIDAGGASSNELRKFFLSWC